MKKWADYCISVVSYTEDPKHISKAKVHKDEGDEMGTGETWNRSQIVSSIESGNSFITIYKSDNKWKQGKDVHIIEVKGKKYIRTDRNATAEDNLGELPEF